MKITLAILLLALTGCIHSNLEEKKEPTEVIKTEESQDWLIGRKINFLQMDDSVFMSRQENMIHYLGYKNPDKIAVKIGRSLYYLPKVAAVTMPSDFLKDFQEVDTKTEFTIIGSYTRRMSDWQERMWPLIYRMLIVQDTNDQKYVVY